MRIFSKLKKTNLFGYSSLSNLFKKSGTASNPGKNQDATPKTLKEIQDDMFTSLEKGELSKTFESHKNLKTFPAPAEEKKPIFLLFEKSLFDKISANHLEFRKTYLNNLKEGDMTGKYFSSILWFVVLCLLYFGKDFFTGIFFNI
jgi:hypothetical protein